MQNCALGVECGTVAGASEPLSGGSNDAPEVGAKSRKCFKAFPATVDEDVLVRNEGERIEGEPVSASQSHNRALPQAGRNGDTQEDQQRGDRGNGYGTPGKFREGITTGDQAGRVPVILEGIHATFAEGNV